MPTRKHLYKAKRKDNGEWVKGYLSETTICGACGAYLAFVINEKPKSVFGGRWYEVDLETVCEYTGIPDKNGDEIFEGDLIKDKSDLVWLVAFEKGAFVCKDEEYRTYFNFYEHENFDDYEVIGNIHDNIELWEL